MSKYHCVFHESDKFGKLNNASNEVIATISLEISITIHTGIRVTHTEKRIICYILLQNRLHDRYKVLLRNPENTI